MAEFSEVESIPSWVSEGYELLVTVAGTRDSLIRQYAGQDVVLIASGTNEEDLPSTDYGLMVRI